MNSGSYGWQAGGCREAANKTMDDEWMKLFNENCMNGSIDRWRYIHITGVPEIGRFFVIDLTSNIYLYVKTHTHASTRTHTSYKS